MRKEVVKASSYIITLPKIKGDNLVQKANRKYWPSIICFAVMVAYVLLMPANVAASGPKETATFRFAPLNGTKLTQVYRCSFNTSIKSKELQSSKSYTTLITRNIAYNQTPHGYSIVAQPTSASYYENESKTPISNPIVNAKMNLTITKEVGPDGQLLALRGIDKLPDLVKENLNKKQLSPNTLVQIKMAEENLITTYKLSWKEKVDDLIGRKVKPGDTWNSVGTATIPFLDSTTTIPTKATFVGWVAVDGYECVRIKYYYNPSIQCIRKIFGAPLKGSEMQGLFDEADIQIIGEGERVVDPATLITYSERYIIKSKFRFAKDDPDVYTTEEIYEIIYCHAN